MEYIDRLVKAKEERSYVVIPDIKCYSPKEGNLLKGRNPVEVAKILVDAGAPVLSVVTEPKNFKGSLELLKKIHNAVDVPLLRKDFIYTKEDLIETKNYGASAILLMCSCLEKEKLEYLYHEAIQMGLDPFVETHTKEELLFATELGAKLIGINNRNILELECDDGNVSRTCEMAADVPQGSILVSESSIGNSEEVRMAIKAGADCALVGTAIWQAKDPGLFYKMLCAPISVKICGLKTPTDINMCIKHGVPILGFVTEYPVEVPWNLKKEEAKELISQVPSTHKTCIVTGGKPNEIINLAMELRPDMVQLHYQETLEDTIIIANHLSKEGIGIVKTVPLTEKEQIHQFGTTNIKDIVYQLCQTAIGTILVDARGPSNVRGHGMSVDRDIFNKIIEYSSKKVMLAGGITPENVSDVLGKTKAEHIDIMTGVEESPGVKEEEKIKGIMEQVMKVIFERSK